MPGFIYTQTQKRNRTPDFEGAGLVPLRRSLRYAALKQQHASPNPHSAHEATPDDAVNQEVANWLAAAELLVKQARKYDVLYGLSVTFVVLCGLLIIGGMLMACAGGGFYLFYIAGAAFLIGSVCAVFGFFSTPNRQYKIVFEADPFSAEALDLLVVAVASMDTDHTQVMELADAFLTRFAFMPEYSTSFAVVRGENTAELVVKYLECAFKLDLPFSRGTEDFEGILRAYPKGIESVEDGRRKSAQYGEELGRLLDTLVAGLAFPEALPIAEGAIAFLRQVRQQVDNLSQASPALHSTVSFVETRHRGTYTEEVRTTQTTSYETRAVAALMRAFVDEYRRQSHRIEAYLVRAQRLVSEASPPSAEVSTT